MTKWKKEWTTWLYLLGWVVLVWAVFFLIISGL